MKTTVQVLQAAHLTAVLDPQVVHPMILQVALTVRILQEVPPAAPAPAAAAEATLTAEQRKLPSGHRIPGDGDSRTRMRHM